MLNGRQSKLPDAPRRDGASEHFPYKRHIAVDGIARTPYTAPARCMTPIMW